MKPLAECLLYTFIDTTYLGSTSPEAVARQLCDGGSDLIQLRAKNIPAGEVLKLAERIIGIVQAAGVRLVVNDYPEIAAAAGAPLCHLGQEDFFEGGYHHVDQISDRWPDRDRLRIGLSTHAPEQAERAIAAGAAYVAVGPVYATCTKPTVQPVTLSYVRWAAANVRIPWFAIGGITLANLDAVLEAGARRVCVVSAIVNSGDLVRTCQSFKNRLLSAGRAQSKF